MKSGGHELDADLKAIEDHDGWAKLHDELRILPKSFREPLILCYLEGPTQDQAAAQLHCPLGTIQSQLARGRPTLKAKLEKRGLSLSSAFVGVGRRSRERRRPGRLRLQARLLILRVNRSLGPVSRD